MPVNIPPAVWAAAFELFREAVMAITSKDTKRLKRASVDMAADRLEKEAAERIMKGRKK